jgi:hypothetical protein
MSTEIIHAFAPKKGFGIGQQTRCGHRAGRILGVKVGSLKATIDTSKVTCQTCLKSINSARRARR